MHTIANSILTAAFDDGGRLVTFHTTDLEPQNLLATLPAFTFRMTTQLGDCKENLVTSAEQSPAITSDGQSFVCHYDSLLSFDGQRTTELAIRLTLRATLQNDQLIFSAEIDNQSAARILDFTYPCVGPIRTLGGSAPALLMPSQCGERWQAIGKMLGAQAPHRENGANALCRVYPATASMNWMALTDDSRSLFLTSHDPHFFPTELRVQGQPGQDSVSLLICRSLCLAPGKQLQVGDTILHAYRGTWHRGVQDYADWMAPYRPAHPVPDWVRNMTGYFLVINKQQFGYEMWPYDTLPELYRHAQAHGCDTLGLFGWYHSGHDNQYPDLEVSPTLGGADALRKNIAAVRQQGGHVTLYYQGHLIDEASDYYRHGDGQEVASKNIWGNPIVEFYSKSHQSDFLRDFSRKVFHIACPSSEKWRNLMRDRQDWLASFQPDGCLYDQIGGCFPYICFDEQHHHDLDCPALAMTGGRQKLLRTLQTHSKDIAPEFAFFSEHITDLYSAYLDACHGIGTVPSAHGANAAASASPEIPRHLSFPALFRFAFPQTIITLRNPAPYISRAFANFALAYGFRYEMEIRYQADCTDLKNDAYAAERVYAAALSRLRDACASTLLRGTFRDTAEIRAANPAVITTSFVSADGRSLACVLWNDTDTTQSLAPFQPADDWTFACAHSLAGSGETIPESIPENSIIVLTYTK